MRPAVFSCRPGPGAGARRTHIVRGRRAHRAGPALQAQFGQILTAKSALEGERKQVTVLFADLIGSMELLADRDPEEARKLRDPVLEHVNMRRHQGSVIGRVLAQGPGSAASEAAR